MFKCLPINEADFPWASHWRTWSSRPVSGDEDLLFSDEPLSGCRLTAQSELPFRTITCLVGWPDCSEPDSISRIRRCNDQVEGTIIGSRCSWFFGVFLDMAIIQKAYRRSGNAVGIRHLHVKRRKVGAKGTLVLGICIWDYSLSRRLYLRNIKTKEEVYQI